jgi:hypothetical protein
MDDEVREFDQLKCRIYTMLAPYRYLNCWVGLEKRGPEKYF